MYLSDSEWFICTLVMILFCVTAFVLFKVVEIFLRLLAVAITTGLGLFPISDILIKEIGVSERNQKEMKETQIKN